MSPKDNPNFNEDVATEAISNDTAIVNVSEIVNKDKVKYADMPDTVVEELKYLGEEYGGGSYKENK